MRESRIINIWLGAEKQKIPEDIYSGILCVDLKDIELLKKIEPLLKNIMADHGLMWVLKSHLKQI